MTMFCERKKAKVLNIKQKNDKPTQECFNEDWSLLLLCLNKKKHYNLLDSIKIGSRVIYMWYTNVM